MNTEETMKLAIEQDVARFYAYLEKLKMRSAYADKQDEISALQTQFLGLEDSQNYPHINFPPEVPDWVDFMFVSKFDADYMAQQEAKKAEWEAKKVEFQEKAATAKAKAQEMKASWSVV